jgi:hypothetical protein
MISFKEREYLVELVRFEFADLDKYVDIVRALASFKDW